jgi:hypothetical protein
LFDAALLLSVVGCECVHVPWHRACVWCKSGRCKSARCWSRGGVAGVVDGRCCWVADARVAALLHLAKSQVTRRSSSLRTEHVPSWLVLRHSTRLTTSPYLTTPTWRYNDTHTRTHDVRRHHDTYPAAHITTRRQLHARWQHVAPTTPPWIRPPSLTTRHAASLRQRTGITPRAPFFF